MKSPPGTARKQYTSAIALHYYEQGKFDSAISYWDKAFADFKAHNRWDSILIWTEKYIIANSRIYQTDGAHKLLDTLEWHLTNSTPADAIELSKIWVRRSELLYTEGKATASRDTLLAVLQVRKHMLSPDDPLIGDAYDYLELATANIGDYWQAAYYGELGIAMMKKTWQAGRKDEVPNLPWVIGNTGECYNALGDYDKAIQYLREAYDLLMKENAPAESRAFYQIMLASCYRKKGDYRAALELLQKAEAAIQKTSVKSHLAEVYGEIAGCYKEIGFHEEMMEYAQRQYDIYKQIHANRDHIQLVQSLSLLASCCVEAGKPDAAGLYLEKALRSLTRLGDTSILLYTDLIALQGTRYAKLDRYDEARRAFETVLNTKKEKLGAGNDQTALAGLELAKLFHETGDYKNSGVNARQALSVFLKTRGGFHPYIKQCLYLIAYEYYIQNKRGQALTLIGNAVHAIAKDDQLKMPDRSDLQLQMLKTRLLQPNDKSTDIVAWNACLQEYFRLSEAYQRFLENVVWEGSNFINAEDIIKHLKNGVAIAHRLYTLTNEERYIDYAISLSEISRAQSIRLSLQHYKANKFAGVPDSIIKQEEKLRIDKTQLEKLVLNAVNSHAPDSIVSHWKEKLLNLQRDYGRFVKILATQYPQYYKLKMETEAIGSTQLIRYTKDYNTAIISYMATDSGFYAVMIKKNQCSFIKLSPSPAELSGMVLDYRTCLLKGDAANYYNAARLLFEKTVQPLGAIEEETVCVIPDDALWYVSFESLVSKAETQPRDFQTLHYALLDRNWRYSFSMNLLFETRTDENQTGQWVAIAPGFEEEDRKITRDSIYRKLIKQPWTQQLAADLKSQFNASVFTGVSATEARYNRSAKDAAVMYIGTHAFPNDEDPMQSLLVFTQSDKNENTDGYLHAYEIYRSPMQAKLVVLGACETGYGRLRSGEGVISLASGFAYAGCRSLIMSLWRVDDKQTAALLHTFFNNARDASVTRSLTEAKRNYLTQCSDDRLCNPFYWSGLICVGSDETLSPAKKDKGWWWFAVAALMGAGGYVLYKRTK